MAGKIRQETMEKAELAGAKVLCNLGFQIVEEDYEHAGTRADFVAKDEDGTIHFVFFNVQGPPSAGFDRVNLDRASCESLAAHYFTEHDSGDDFNTITFDILSLSVLSEERAIVRLYRNALASAEVA